jgi:uncharacterized protein YcgI (DUF1989 family)
MTETVQVAARSGKAVKLQAGWSVKLINTLGSQVVDTWAFNAQDLAEHMSMEHTRVMLGRLNPRNGDQLFSNRRRPLLKMTEDTSPGVHDTLRAACDPVRYKLLGHENHASCQENLAAALRELGLRAPHSPCPLNMFENCPVGEAGKLVVVPPPVKAGEYVVLTAEVDAIVVFSACPMDIFPTNGPDCTPKPVAYQVIRN